MSYYGTAFKNIANDPFGEALRQRIKIRKLDASNRLYNSGIFLNSQGGTTAWYDSAGCTRVDVSGSISSPYGNATRVDNDADPTPWEHARNDLLGAYDPELPSTIVIDVNVLTFSAVVKKESAAKVGLGIMNDTIVGDPEKRFSFTWDGSGNITGYTIHDTDGKAGYTDLGSGWWHIWCAVDMSALGWIGDDIELKFFPNPGDTPIGTVGTYVCHAQVEYNLPYSDDPSPRGIVETGAEVKIKQPGTLVELSANEHVLAVNPVRVKRDRRFGVVEGQQWQATLTNLTKTISSNELAGAMAALEMGFPTAAEWALLAQGRIAKTKANSQGSVVIDVDDPMRQMLDGELRRWVFFDTTAHASDIETVQRGDSSSEYDMDATNAGVVVTASASVAEQEWLIEFMTATTFKLIDEAGTEDDNSGAGYPISADCTALAGLTIKKEGWDTGVSAYAAGDTFRFAASRQRTAAELHPIAIIKELLKDEMFLGLQVVDVLSGGFYASPLYDDGGSGTKWYDAENLRYTTVSMAGEWEKGSKITEMVQGVLKVIHGSIYTMPTGQLALWETQPNTMSAINLNGDPAAGRVQILHCDQQDTLEDVYNVVRYIYRNLNDGAVATLEARTSNVLTTEKVLKVNLGSWRVDKGSIDAAASKALSRVKNNRRAHELRTILAGAVIDMDTPISFNDPVLGIVDTTLVREVQVDPKANEARLVAQIDPVVLENYARVGDAGTIPIGSTVGSTDPIF